MEEGEMVRRRHALRQRQTKEDEAEREKDESKGEKKRENERCRRGKRETSVRGINHFSWCLDVNSELFPSLFSFNFSKHLKVKVPLNAYVFLTLTNLFSVKWETQKASGLEPSRDNRF